MRAQDHRGWQPEPFARSLLDRARQGLVAERAPENDVSALDVGHDAVVAERSSSSSRSSVIGSLFLPPTLIPRSSAARSWLGHGRILARSSLPAARYWPSPRWSLVAALRLRAAQPCQGRGASAAALGHELLAAELEQRQQLRGRLERIGERRAAGKRQSGDDRAVDLCDDVPAPRLRPPSSSASRSSAGSSPIVQRRSSTVSGRAVRPRQAGGGRPLRARRLSSSSCSLIVICRYSGCMAISLLVSHNP